MRRWTDSPNVNSVCKKRWGRCGRVCDYDGDATARIGIKRVFMNQLQVMALLAFIYEIRKNAVRSLNTLTTTMRINLEDLWRTCLETASFKYCGPKVYRNECHHRGEESGGSLSAEMFRSDGILANLYMLDFMVKTGKKHRTAERSVAIVGRYSRIDTAFTGSWRQKKLILENQPKTLGGLR